MFDPMSVQIKSNHGSNHGYIRTDTNRITHIPIQTLIHTYTYIIYLHIHTHIHTPHTHTHTYTYTHHNIHIHTHTHKPT